MYLSVVRVCELISLLLTNNENIVLWQFEAFAFQKSTRQIKVKNVPLVCLNVIALNRIYRGGSVVPSADKYITDYVTRWARGKHQSPSFYDSSPWLLSNCQDPNRRHRTSTNNLSDQLRNLQEQKLDSCKKLKRDSTFWTASAFWLLFAYFSYLIDTLHLIWIFHGYLQKLPDWL